MNVFGSVFATLRKVCRTLTGAVGLVIVLLVLGCAVFAPWVATHNPDALDVMNRFSRPTAAHWLGTDHLGRDLFSRMVHGASIAMQIAMAAIAPAPPSAKTRSTPAKAAAANTTGDGRPSGPGGEQTITSPTPATRAGIAPIRSELGYAARPPGA